MRALHQRVNIVPVLAKADTLTPTEVERMKNKVRGGQPSLELSPQVPGDGGCPGGWGLRLAGGCVHPLPGLSMEDAPWRAAL